MSLPPTGTRRLALGSLAVTATFVMAACGSSGTTTAGGGGGAAAGPTPSVDSALAARVPVAIKSDGKIVIGTDPTYAPSEFLATDGKTVVGFDVDLFNAIAAKLGLRTEWKPAPFAAIIPGVSSGKYEIGVSSLTINPERKQQATMVSYYSAGTQWATKQGNPAGVSVDYACGKRIAVQRDTVQVPDITDRSKKCTQGGNPGIGIDQYQGQDQATASVVSGKDDAMLADSPVAAYAVKQANGQLVTLGDIYASAPYGYVLPKAQAAFGQTLVDALKALIDDGSYRRALAKWGVEGGGISNPAVNP